jgi:thiosulfate/3-mercaptopyruvate sulfurtransferase
MHNPMENDYRTLITADELATLVTVGETTRPLVVVDCRFNLAIPEEGRESYLHDHIPGAYYAHLDDDLAAPVSQGSGRHPLPEIEQFRLLAGSWGVTPEAQVVVYDQGGGAVAARLWWMLRWIGHPRVALLEGGFRGWKEGGYPLGADIAQPVPDPLPAGTPGQHACWISTPALEKELAGVCLLDARSAERFRGEREPIDPVAGHVPGALNRPFTENLDESGRFHSSEKLRKQFLALPGGGCRRIVHMCGSGVTACHNILAMEVAGLGASDLYVGSWSEWIRDPSRPVVVEKR